MACHLKPREKSGSYCLLPSSPLPVPPLDLSSVTEDATPRVRRTLHKGFYSVFWGDENGDPIEIQCCDECVLFGQKRSERAGENSCRELRHEWAYWLRPHDLSDFELYREQIKAQIFINESYFHEWFIDALQWYPELHYNEFRIKISIDIKEGEINVANVILEALKETGPRDGGPKGKIALAFKARFSGGTVGFNLGVDVPLEGEELQPKMGKDGLPWYHDRDPYSAKAQEIVNLLSDVNGEQLMSGTWKLSPDIFQKFIRRRHPNRFTRLIQLFCNYDNKNIAPKVEDLQEKQVRVLEVEDEEEEEAPWERRQ